jgi:hypothetical protein
MGGIPFRGREGEADLAEVSDAGGEHRVGEPVARFGDVAVVGVLVLNANTVLALLINERQLREKSLHRRGREVIAERHALM